MFSGLKLNVKVSYTSCICSDYDISDDDVSTACPDDMSITSSPERCTRVPVTPDVNLDYEEPKESLSHVLQFAYTTSGRTWTRILTDL